jgi:hypothetical protein
VLACTDKRGRFFRRIVLKNVRLAKVKPHDLHTINYIIIFL